MKKRITALAAAVAFLAIIGACGGGGGGGDNPLSSNERVHSCYIVGNAVTYAASTTSAIQTVVFIDVRRGDRDGEPVSGAAVRVNGHTLNYYEGNQFYAGEIAGALPGTVFTVKISEGGEETLAQVECPNSVNNLALLEYPWNTSSPDAYNTIVWKNPSLVGDYINIYLFEVVGTRYSQLLGASMSSHFQAAAFANSQFDYSGSIDSLVFEVFQVNSVDFPDVVEGSHFSAMTGRSVTTRIGKGPANPAKGRIEAPGEVFRLDGEPRDGVPVFPLPGHLPLPGRRDLPPVQGK